MEFAAHNNRNDSEINYSILCNRNYKTIGLFLANAIFQRNLKLPESVCILRKH